jgi:hypothetical protein
MGAFLKQPQQRAKKRESKKQPQPPPVPDSTSVAEAIRHFASIVNTYVSDARNGEHHHTVHATDDENKLAIFTGPSGSGFHPVLIALEPSDTTDDLVSAAERIATAFERIADAMMARSENAT